MLKAVQHGAANVSVVVRFVDSTDGTPEEGVTSATAGLNLWYRRESGLVVNLTESDLTALTDAHSDGGMLHIDDGYYRVDIPDAAFASGVDGVMIGGTATGMVVIGCYVALVADDPQTDDVGTAGAGLTAVPWNPAWDAEVESEANDALVALGLDHLVSAAVVGTDVADDSIMARLVSSAATADWDTFAHTTDSLQAVRDHIGDGTNLTEAGGTGDHLTGIPWNAAWDVEVESEVTDALVAIHLDHLLAVDTPAPLPGVAGAILQDLLEDDGGTWRYTSNAVEQVWSVATRILTANTNFNDPTAAAIADAVWDELRSAHVAAGSFGEGVASVQGNVTGSVASVTGAVGSVTAAVTVGTINTDVIDATAVATVAWEEAADVLLGRSIQGGANGGRDVTSALRRVRNRIAIVAGTMTVYTENDTTSAWTAAVTTTAGDPISEIDPA